MIWLVVGFVVVVVVCFMVFSVWRGWFRCRCVIIFSWGRVCVFVFFVVGVVMVFIVRNVWGFGCFLFGW